LAALGGYPLVFQHEVDGQAFAAAPDLIRLLDFFDMLTKILVLTSIGDSSGARPLACSTERLERCISGG
jgi:hypothetical protein